LSGPVTFFRNIFTPLFLFAAFSPVILSYSTPASAQDIDQKFAEAKGKFLLTALNYIELPAGADKYNICVVGDKQVFISARDFYESNKGRLKPTSLKSIDSGSDGISSCHIVFIGKNYAERDAIMAKISAEKNSVISISDSKNFAAGKGTMELFDDDGKLSFIINLKKAKQPGLKIDSRMIELAYKTI